MVGKPIEIVEYSDKPEQLIKNALYPAKIKNIRKIEKNNKVTMIVEVDPKDKALAIGRNGKTIEKARMLVKRYFQIERVIIV
jgi:N utilization substance protein A